MSRSMETVGARSPIAAPEAPALDQSVVDDLEASFALSSATPETRDTNTKEAETAAETQPDSKDFYARMADKLTNSTARAAAVLEFLSAGAPARQEARAETMEAAKETVKKVGRGALKGAKAVGLFTLGMTVLTAETVVDGGVKARTTVTEIAMKARVRFAERAAHKENKRRDQEAAFASYESNIDATQNREENERLDAEYKAEELAMLNEAHDDNDAFDAERARQEATQQREAEARAEFEAYKAELLERKAAAFFRKQERKERRAEIIGNLKEKGSEIYGAAKRGAKRFGRAALKIAKRTMSAGKAAAKAAVSAGAQAWRESSTPAPSN